MFRKKFVPLPLQLQKQTKIAVQRCIHGIIVLLFLHQAKRGYEPLASVAKTTTLSPKIMKISAKHICMALMLLMPATAMADKKVGFKKGIHDYAYADGRVYSGNWLDRLPSGEGKMIMTNGDTYEGTWVMGQLQGDGVIYKANGDKYMGHFVNTQMSGQCKVELATGEHYEGGVTNGLLEGTGVVTYSDGKKYEGLFSQGKRHGRGTLYCTDGQVWEVVYKEGVRAPKLTIKDNAKGLEFVGTVDEYDNPYDGHLTVNDGSTGQIMEMDIQNGKPVGDITTQHKGATPEDCYKAIAVIIDDKQIIKCLEWDNGMKIDFDAPYVPDTFGRQTGRMTLANGNVYVGQMKQAVPDGEGTLTQPKGGKFVGTFVDGCEMEGEYQNFIDEKGDEWTVHVADGKPEGMGTVKNRQGGSFEGTFKNGLQLEGICTNVFFDNDDLSACYYTGPIKNSLCNGKGTMKWVAGSDQEGDVYEGEFVDGKFNGQGVYTWADGGRYEGQWANGVRQGQGTRFYANGEKYVGQWKNGLFCGQGTYTWPDGTKHVGTYADDARNGQGTYTWPDGSKYVGNFKDGERSGQGTHYYANGNKYVGQWANDKPNGQGVRTYAPGTPWRKETGTFVDDHFRRGTLVRTNGTFTGEWDDEGNKIR